MDQISKFVHRRRIGRGGFEGENKKRGKDSGRRDRKNARQKWADKSPTGIPDFPPGGIMNEKKSDLGPVRKTSRKVVFISPITKDVGVFRETRRHPFLSGNERF